MLKIFSASLLLLLVQAAFGADTTEVRQLQVQFTSTPPKIDGELNEALWQEAEHMATDFWQYFPFDTARATTRTEVLMFFDDKNVYLGFRCYDPEPGGFVTNSLRRDFRGTHNDAITVVFDPFSDQTNGMFFGINPFGVQREGLISGVSGGRAGSSGFDLSWDNRWFGEASIKDDYWTAEMAIPLKTLRYEKGSETWMANFYRLDSKTAERSTWGNIPRNQSIVSLAFSGNLQFEKPLPKTGANVVLIPYVTGGVSKDHLAGTGQSSTGNIGGDAKIAVTPSLNLDLTFNPDFSQVEVDVQQTNITRFELFFPERRQFFLENADLFSSFGMTGVRPFFSRRIGLALDESTGLNVPTQINYGARLSGRIDENWRIGAMNMQTAKDGSINLPGYNYSVMALQRQVFARSNISAIFINKQATNRLNGDSTLVSGIDGGNYHRLVGLDYNLASDDNRWSGKFFYHQAFDPDKENSENFSHGVQLVYDVPAWRIQWEHQLVGEEFEPDVGFTPRQNFFSINPSVQYRMYPNGKIANHGPGVSMSYIWNQQDGKTDQLARVFYEANFSNNAELVASIDHEYTYLFSEFDPTRTGEGEALPQGSDYNYTTLNAGYQSDQRRFCFYNLEFQGGQFFNGNLYRLAGDVNFRFQPYVLATLNFAYNRINLPEPFSSGDIVLFGPRFDITFTRKIFLTTFLQYNNQIDNINLNARLQYRFKPVSDFFLVYTDNYFPENLRVKNRAVVAKLTYWLNL